MVRQVMYLSIVALVLWATSSQAALVHHWKLDESTAATTADSVGGLSGTIQGAQSVAGKSGNALSFDGADDVMTILNFVPPQQGTIVFWINPALARSKERILGAGGDYEVWLRNNGELKNELFDNGSTTIGTGAGALKANEWNHVATTYDGAAKTVEIYINGEMKGSGPANLPSTPTQTTLLFGHRAGAAAGEHYKGLIDDIRIYDHVLSQVEVKALASPPRFTARDPNPPDGAVNEATWATLSWSPGDFAASHNVYFGESFDDVNAGAAATFAGNQLTPPQLVGIFGYPHPDGLSAGTTYYWRIDEVNNADPNSPWKGPVWSFSIPPTTAYNPNPADGAGLVNLNAELSWAAGFGAKLHTVFFGDDFDDVNNATQGALVGVTTYSPGPLQREKVYYWRVDEGDGAVTYKGATWSFATLGAVGNPQPANGAANVAMNPVLTWGPSDHAASHQVYFGLDEEAVRRAGTTAPEYKGTRALGAQSYDPGLRAWDSTYYWRVDEVNNVNPNSPWKGPLWSFTTGDFLIVDDFESYNDINLGEPGSNRIFEAWIDGFETPATNGALVGNENAPFMERSIVHGGSQSVPLSYNNNLKYSQATRTLTTGRDWTAQGVANLSLWFRGKSANAAERMYVVLNGIAVVYHDNPNAAQIDRWTQWVIPLQAFADLGVDLANVTSITIGFGTPGNTTAAGGSGQMYFDDIRLYRSANAS